MAGSQFLIQGQAGDFVTVAVERCGQRHAQHFNCASDTIGEGFGVLCGQAKNGEWAAGFETGHDGDRVGRWKANSLLFQQITDGIRVARGTGA